MHDFSQPVIALATFELEAGNKFDEHVHDVDQLAWVREGVLMVTVGSRHWMLPPSLALWIPAGTWHTTTSVRSGTMQGIYLNPRVSAVQWKEPTVVSVPTLLREMINYLGADLAEEPRKRAEALMPDLLQPVSTFTIELPMPSDSRAIAIAESLLANPADPRDLAAWGLTVGASTRTLSRIFADETGSGFGQWRTALRLRAALAHLAEGAAVSQVATRVGYSSTSAFIAAFRKIAGQTPGAYFAQLSPQPESA
ncbi:helix-turn-helix domain-containing protein [Arthrobacter russicus]|uniref:AraC-like DNA-binding protein n=1 Tax=Arthrobacter russicus TaxID=172040 RepID=A0ABU1JFE7_9MICC|nr:helix-turn-helix transcriptional regulator [Arthrobacter russicus]MDN5667584.1 helix-turn-helix transcriptional regulator [Renibacterium salmoninarum]MDR6270107.1 AraC-like DNA-binding protein [Arthrobacter russicus]